MMVTVSISLVAIVISSYIIIRSLAIDSMGELRFMIKCAEDRREIVADNPRLLAHANAEIATLQAKLDNHWGRKIANNHKSIFDIIPTPKEDPDGKFLRTMLNGRIKRTILK